jgi:hypothetical protein
VRLVAGLLLLALPGAAALSAPPPPVIYPSDLPRRAGGYDLEPLYAVYYSWISRGRKSALTKALPDQATWQGKHYWGPVVESEILHYDFGVLRMDRLERYCTGQWVAGEPPGTCEFRYRYAFVPGSLYNDEAQDKRIRDSFRPRDLAAAAAKARWKQAGTDPWTNGRLTEIFEGHTDLAAFYQPLVELHDVKSSACPGFSNALAKLDKITLNLSPDGASFAGSDFPVHGQQTQIRLTARSSKGNRLVLEGAEALLPEMEHIWMAVEACAKMTTH